ncbi:hypothetical protein F9L07_19580 [Pimelobacter simplex]|uniref:Uncharacterized protein n=1 Tax=Nocardioides simplex TaxID=2045 RepID=A0A7J5DV92_NOCSI|nr:hypothetical protein [Pimelobacter simplex]KAB2809244.1 hypothetical protein F9L07_19580 [Pimelobacter simplex]
MAELTDTQRTRIDDALVETGCHGFRGDHPDLYAEAELIVREHVTAALDEIERRIEAWIRHGEAVPADVTTYDREIVHRELRALICDYRQEQDR